MPPAQLPQRERHLLLVAELAPHREALLAEPHSCFLRHRRKPNRVSCPARKRARAPQGARPRRARPRGVRESFEKSLTTFGAVRVGVPEPCQGSSKPQLLVTALPTTPVECCPQVVVVYLQASEPFRRQVHATA